MRVFLDTNVLLYAVLRTVSEDERKRERARALLDREDCAVSLQVIQEFANQATHPRHEHRLSWEDAIRHIAIFRQFHVQETTLDVFDQGLDLMRRHHFSFWDAMIVAAALTQGCEILYSEDMQHGRIIERMRIVDPFR